MKKSDKKKKKAKAKKRRSLRRKTPKPLVAPEATPVYELREVPVVSANREADELLGRARMQWQFGDWDSLGKLDLLLIEHHPDRAELALLAGCAALQAGDTDKGGAFLASALRWGCDSRLVFRLLVAGVHNSLGRYHALIGDEDKGQRFFQLAGTGLGGDSKLIGEIRQQREWASLPAPPQAKAVTRLLSGQHVQKETTSSAKAKEPEVPMSEIVDEGVENIVYPLKQGIRSYAQNFEDVMLWRALQNVDNGFYIDVGAQHPVEDSVSKAFYEKGWRGIHVEPIPSYARLLREDRPDEIVIEAGVSNEHGSITFYEVLQTGLSTGDAAIAKAHREKGHQIKETQIPTVTLADIFALAGDREIHWLKIDVEGMERNVLESWGDAPHRPWVVVVESTVPNSKIETQASWEGLLKLRDYSFVYFDGLSRFYLSEKHPERKADLVVPPNVFDGFER